MPNGDIDNTISMQAQPCNEAAAHVSSSGVPHLQVDPRVAGGRRCQTASDICNRSKLIPPFCSCSTTQRTVLVLLCGGCKVKCLALAPLMPVPQRYKNSHICYTLAATTYMLLQCGGCPDCTLVGDHTPYASSSKTWRHAAPAQAALGMLLLQQCAQTPKPEKKVGLLVHSLRWGSTAHACVAQVHMYTRRLSM
jgi:hypothetical protein